MASSVSAGQAQEDDNPSEGLEDVKVPYLDLDSLEAEFDGETLHAESYGDWRSGSTTYVGAAPGRLGRDLFTGVSLLDGTEQSDEDGQPEIVTYLCDGEPGTRDAFGFHLSGEYDGSGVVLTPRDVENAEAIEVVEDVEVKLSLVDGEFLGAANLPDGESVPFLAAEVTGDADIYRATIGPEEEMFAQWIVLPDGRQRGSFIVFATPSPN